LQHFQKAAIWPLKTRSYLWAWNRARFAEGQDEVHEEEGQPADDEGRHDNGHGSRRFPLLGKGDLQDDKHAMS
jgi:hypothetical protein